MAACRHRVQNDGSTSSGDDSGESVSGKSGSGDRRDSDDGENEVMMRGCPPADSTDSTDVPASGITSLTPSKPRPTPVLNHVPSWRPRRTTTPWPIRGNSCVRRRMVASTRTSRPG
mmetsp:Transcript_11291/g.20310  ORF Transcript_11291/g.20310 Transcript_11291/m.20310 type:complete len:116 (-) Transcript_11291:793-1140(-)